MNHKYGAELAGRKLIPGFNNGYLVSFEFVIKNRRIGASIDVLNNCKFTTVNTPNYWKWFYGPNAKSYFCDFSPTEEEIIEILFDKLTIKNINYINDIEARKCEDARAYAMALLCHRHPEKFTINSIGNRLLEDINDESGEPIKILDC